MTAPPRPEWLFDPNVVYLDWDGFPKHAPHDIIDYITYLERELESAEAKLDELRREPETMWGPDL